MKIFKNLKLQSQGLYKNEFIEELKESEKDLKNGRFRKINSLNEL